MEKISKFIGWSLFGNGVSFYVSACVYAFSTTDNSEKWFFRISLSLMCFGFAGIILKKEK